MPDYKWVVTSEQHRFIYSDDVEEILYGGRRGSGKSEAILMFGARRRIKYPGSTCLIVRRRFADLMKEGQPIPRSHVLYAGMATFNGQQHKWIFPGGGTIQFGFLDRDEDVYRYQSASYDDICINQAEQLTAWQMRILLGALRTTRRDLKPLLRMDANPLGRGHAYLRKTYVDAAPPGTVFTAGGKSRLYIDAKPIKHLHPSYQTWLDALPEPQRSAWRDGRWDISAGQYFVVWDSLAHVCEPFAVPRAWPRWMAYDWGMASAAWWGWFTRAPWGTVYVYRELYVARQEPESERWMGTGETVDVQAKRARDVMEPDEHPAVCYAGPDMWEHGAQTGETNESVAARVLSVGFERGTFDRVQGWQRIQRALVRRPVDREGRMVEEPELQVFRTCKHLIRTLPDLLGDEDKPEDVSTDGQEDHPADGLRYGMSKVFAGQPMRPEFVFLGERTTANVPWGES